MVKTRIIYRNAVYRLAQEPPDESKMVSEIESNPFANWEEYLQPIIRALKQQLRVDSVTLLSPEPVTSYVSPAMGFDIVGDVGFGGEERPVEVIDKYGRGPLPFRAYVSGPGQLMLPIDLGSAADTSFRKVI